MQEPTDVIRLYLDDDTEPFKTARPPLRFQFTTLNLADGPHKLRIEAHNGLAGASIREIPFTVRNGVAITVSGIDPGQEIAGQVGVIINAYAGNTEVDFEPTRAETPQPIPTWAWLVFLVVAAFTMFYLLNPSVKPAPADVLAPSDDLGARVFEDTCAKCHQRDGRGLGNVAPLKGADPVLDPSPLDQLKYVVAGGLESGDGGGSGRTKIRMPEFGERLGNAEIVAAVNFTRTHWGNHSPTLTPVVQRAPEEIRLVEDQMAQAIQQRDAVTLGRFYSGQKPPRFVRPADHVDVEGAAEVVNQWTAWLEGVKEVYSYQVLEAAYHVNNPLRDPSQRIRIRLPEQPSGVNPNDPNAPLEQSEEEKQLQDETWVYSHGLLHVTGVTAAGASFEHTGRFIRFYVLEGVAGGDWRVAFDFATVPFSIGCEPDPNLPLDPNCPPGQQTSSDFYFLDVVRLIDGLGQRATGSPHGNFWNELSYDQFVAFEFPLPKGKTDTDGAPLPEGTKLRLVTPGKGAESNLVRALRDGRDLIATLPSGETRRVDVMREPRGGRPMAYDDIARIEAWIDRGMPKERAVEPAIVRPPAGAVPKEPTTAPGETPKEPVPSAMGDDAGAAGDWRPDDVDYAGVQEIFRRSKPKAKSAPHKAFWDKPYAEFVKFEFALQSQDGKVVLLEKDEAGVSNLVKALRDGKGLVVTMPDGSKQTIDVDRMPSNGSPLPDEDIERIHRWVTRGAPEKKP